MSGKKKAKIKNLNSLSYLTVTLEFEEERKCEITRDVFAYIISSAVKTLHGEITAAEPLDILEFNQETLRATISCTRQSLEKIWSALTLFGSYNDQRCLFHVSQIFSPKIEELNNESQENYKSQESQESQEHIEGLF